jgi:uncharacterized protein
MPPGQTPKHATTTSLVLVAITALIAIVPHWRAHRVRFAAGTLFGLVGIAGSLLGSHWNQAANPDLLLLAFAGLMFIAATAMWRRTRQPAPRPPARSLSAATTPAAALNRRFDLTRGMKVAAAGTVVGLLTGFFGVGGGFVIVPALVLRSGSRCPTRSARRCSSSRSTPSSR